MTARSEQSEQEQLWQLHLRRAKGEALTDHEQEQLTNWYIQQEQKERAILQSASNLEELSPLQRQIDTMLAQIAATTAQIQRLTAENRQLRQEVRRLEDQLAHQRAALQPA
jgi:peptidoglycan hydrolase CwlO-like protein